jgi:ferrous iron transport protein A
MTPGDGGPADRPLDRLGPGERGIIARLNGDPLVTRRLMELGLVPGTPVELVRRAPMGDPIELAVRGVHLSLRRTEASHIHVATG